MRVEGHWQLDWMVDEIKRQESRGKKKKEREKRKGMVANEDINFSSLP